MVDSGLKRWQRRKQEDPRIKTLKMGRRAVSLTCGPLWKPRQEDFHSEAGLRYIVRTSF